MFRGFTAVMSAFSGLQKCQRPRFASFYAGRSSFPIVFLVLLLAAECPAGNAPIAQITNVHGTVTINRPGLGRPIAAEQGSDVRVGDEVGTSEGASAQITFSDGSFMNLAQASSIRVNQYAFDETQNRRTVRSRVISGTVRFVAHRPMGPGSLLFVECGSAEITAWSLADFAVIVSPETAEVVVLRGGVGVKNTSPLIVGDVSLGVSQRTVVRGKTPPAQPDIISPAERKQYMIIVR